MEPRSKKILDGRISRSGKILRYLKNEESTFSWWSVVSIVIFTPSLGEDLPFCHFFRRWVETTTYMVLQFLLTGLRSKIYGNHQKLVVQVVQFPCKSIMDSQILEKAPNDSPQEALFRYFLGRVDWRCPFRSRYPARSRGRMPLARKSLNPSRCPRVGKKLFGTATGRCLTPAPTTSTSTTTTTTTTTTRNTTSTTTRGLTYLTWPLWQASGDGSNVV